MQCHKNWKRKVRFEVKSTTTESFERITLGETNIETDLGVYVDQDLLFENHVAKITLEANSIVGIIRRSSNHLNEDLSGQLFKAIIRPGLDYEQSAWLASPSEISLSNFRKRRVIKLVILNSKTYIDWPPLIYETWNTDAEGETSSMYMSMSTMFTNIKRQTL